MARFLMTMWPLVGHINPFMSVAKALMARGHEVAFCTNEVARAQVEAEGVTLIPYRHVDDRSMWQVVGDAETRASRRESARILYRAVHEWIAGTVPAQVEDVNEAVERWRPDAVVTETGMWGPIVVSSETLPVPVAILTTLMGCLIPGPDAPPGGAGLPAPRGPWSRWLCRAMTGVGDLLATRVRRRINQIRAGHGLPPMNGSVNAHMATLPLYLVPSLRELDYGRNDLPANVQYVGACVWNKSSSAPRPEWMEQLPRDEPWVHVTEGTAHYRDPFVLRSAARGLAGMPAQVILTTGPQRDPSGLDLGPIASNVRVEQWVSHSDLLPRCSVLVTTGGAGTILASLRYGVPLVVIPTHWDKPDNARRIVDAMLGLAISPRRCTPDRLRRAVDRILANPEYAANARRIAAKLADRDGPDRAAELLESLVSTCRREPVQV
ncbi:MAG: glycosyltransferase [Isosphaeraceae bacterium]